MSDLPSSAHDLAPPLTDDALDAVVGGFLAQGAEPDFRCKTCGNGYYFAEQLDGHMKSFTPNHTR